jgi:hypothetical protein
MFEGFFVDKSTSAAKAYATAQVLTGDGASQEQLMAASRLRGPILTATGPRRCAPQRKGKF